MSVNFFYDCSAEHDLSCDPEGDLVVMCERCAKRYESSVEYAQDGDGNDTCELCGSRE